MRGSEGKKRLCKSKQESRDGKERRDTSLDTKVHNLQEESVQNLRL